MKSGSGSNIATQRDADLVADDVREQLRNSIDNIHSELEQLYQEELTTHKSQLQAAHEKLRQRRRSDLARRMQESHRLQALKEAKAETDDSRRDKVNQFKEKMRHAAEKSLTDEGMVLQRLRPPSSGQDGRALTPLSAGGESSNVTGLRIRSTFEEQLAVQQRVLSSHMHAMRALHSQQFFPPSPTTAAEVVPQPATDTTAAIQSKSSAPAFAPLPDSSLFGARAELRKLREEMLWLAPEEVISTKAATVPKASQDDSTTPPTSSRTVLPPLGKTVKTKVMAKLQEVEAREVLDAKTAHLRQAGAVAFEDVMQDGRIIQDCAHANNKRYDDEVKQAALEAERTRVESSFAVPHNGDKSIEGRTRASFVTFGVDDHEDSIDVRSTADSSFQGQESIIIARGSQVFNDSEAVQRESDRQAFQQFQQQRNYNRKVAEQRAQLSSLRSKLQQLLAEGERSASPIASLTKVPEEISLPATVTTQPEAQESHEAEPQATSEEELLSQPKAEVEPKEGHKTAVTAGESELRRAASACKIQRLARRFIARQELNRRREALQLALRARAAELAAEDEQFERDSLVQLVASVRAEPSAPMEIVHAATLKPSDVDAQIAAVDLKEEAELLATLAEHEAYIDLLHRETLLVSVHNAAARRIQLFVREALLLRKLKAKRRSDETKLRQTLAVAVLQRWFRGFIQTRPRRRQAKFVMERRRRLAQRYAQASGIANIAASCIQTLFRGKRAIRQASVRRESRPNSRLVVEGEAVLLIQKHFRRYLQRDTVRQRWTERLLREALERVQAERDES